MSPGRRVRVAKCQMLATCFLVVLLALCVATFVTVTYFGAHMAVIHQASPVRNPYEESHRWAFYLGTGLAGILATGAVLSAAATVREAQGLMAAGFLCFAMAFCALVQVVLWRLYHPIQVEEAALDTFDLVYDRALRTASGTWQRELAAIQDTVSPVPVLWEEVAFQLPGTHRCQPVSWSQGTERGLPGGHPELPADTAEGGPRPAQHCPGPHGARPAALLLPLVRHPHMPRPAPQRQIHPDAAAAPAGVGATPPERLLGQGPCGSTEGDRRVSPSTTPPCLPLTLPRPGLKDATHDTDVESRKLRGPQARSRRPRRRGASASTPSGHLLTPGVPPGPSAFHSSLPVPSGTFCKSLTVSPRTFKIAPTPLEHSGTASPTPVPPRARACQP